MKPTFDQLSSAFSYCPETGLVSRGGVESGYTTHFGYRLLSFKKQRLYAHQVAWCLMTGDWPSEELDHINGNKVDNRWCNLRLATRQQNARNQTITSKNTSGYKGVSFHTKVGRWRAVIKWAGHHLHLGYFNTKEAAASAYANAASHYFGEFARL